MPRPVVPILRSPRAASRARSIAPCSGRIRMAFSAMRNVSGVTVSPCARTRAISASSASGSITTPLPMMPSLPRTRPEGSNDSL